MESSESVDELNERLTENVRSGGASKIGFVRVTGRKRMNKPWWNDDIKDARRECKRLNKQCRPLKKRRHDSEEAEGEYQSVWIVHMKQQ